MGHSDPHTIAILRGQFLGGGQGGSDLGYYGRHYQWGCIYSFKRWNAPRPEAGKWYEPPSKSNHLVLYSQQDHVWKVADFGLTTEGSSRRAHSTVGCWGTSGYRAPELIRGHFNNKVDIFAIGCILYEIVFRKKAFKNDVEIQRYSESNQSLPLRFEPDTLPDRRRKELVSNMIYETLDIVASQRPRAVELHDTFGDSADPAWFQNLTPNIPLSQGHVGGFRRPQSDHTPEFEQGKSSQWPSLISRF